MAYRTLREAEVDKFRLAHDRYPFFARDSGGHGYHSCTWGQEDHNLRKILCIVLLITSLSGLVFIARGII